MSFNFFFWSTGKNVSKKKPKRQNSQHFHQAGYSKDIGKIRGEGTSWISSSRVAALIFCLKCFQTIFEDQFFVGQFTKFFMKFENQNFPSVRIFVFRKTTKFPFTLQIQFTLQSRQFAYILLQKVSNYLQYFLAFR